jgi:hypothetical protein
VLRLTTANSFTNAIIRGAGRVRLDAASLTLNGVTKLEGGTLELANGFIDGSSAFEGPGTFAWTGGELRGSHTINAGGSMLISGAADKNVAGSSSLSNNGTIQWTGTGNIRGVGQSKIVNNGVFEAQNDAGFAYYNNGASPVGVFENNGTLRKAGGTGTTAFLQDYGGWRFANAGTLEVRSGTVSMGERLEPSAGAKTILRISDSEEYGRLNFPTPVAFTGALTVELANGFIPATNETFVLASYPSRSGEFTSPALPALGDGRAWKLDYGANKLELSVTTASVAKNGSASFQPGNFKLSLSGPPGKYALLQSTTNLVDWVNIQTNQPFSGEFQFADPGATGARKFYRTVIVP